MAELFNLSCKPQVLSKPLKRLCIGAIGLPNWIVRIASQIYRGDAMGQTAT
jgi:hypothetical protein